MRLRIRTLSNEEAEVQVEGEDTVFTLKEKIEERWNNMPANRQKLVHAGKILVDTSKIKDCPSLKENDRLVVMVTKAAAPSAPPAPESSSSSVAPGGAEEESKKNNNKTPEESRKEEGSSSSSSSSSTDASKASTKAEESTAPSSSSSGASASTRSQRDLAESALYTGPQLEETLSQLVAMGFPRSQAEIAMRAAFNNPDRAVEYLMNGMPGDVATGMFANAAEEEEEDEEEEELPAEGSRGEGEEGDSTTSSSNPLAALRHHPAFNQIRQMIQTNPAMLPQVLQLIGSSNPQLLQLISENQDAFLEILQSDDQAGGEEGGASTAAAAGGLGRGGGIIQMTPEEIEALQRLEALGFPRHQALEAYLACDRNEEMAANFLFENMNDEDLADGRRD
ncbi:uv excision repair protein rad23 protein [Cystoisospora suis]|uniref:UV excision repair protein RAD23 n=1 Tax=Cystoisospora suis TaxID=483139 RepID=A0A2C6LFJ5_9APIC|nr:uv excision repair protein rad23 protein [Cystoisospora suis]